MVARQTAQQQGAVRLKQSYTVLGDDHHTAPRTATVLSLRGQAAADDNSGLIEEAYVHYEGCDSRLDEWLPVAKLLPLSLTNGTSIKQESGSLPPAIDLQSQLGVPAAIATLLEGSPQPALTISQQIAQTYTSHATAEAHAPKRGTLKPRQISKVIWGWHEINCWYSSPYLLEDAKPTAGTSSKPNGVLHEADSGLVPAKPIKKRPASDSDDDAFTPGKLSKVPARKPKSKQGGGKNASLSEDTHHEYASSTDDFVASTSGRKELPRKQPRGSVVGQPSTNGHAHAMGSVVESSVLYVCDGCFKYFYNPPVYQTHRRICKMAHPPGRKVYQRGAHILWEIDGAQHKLFCQNLALFGKLFIDHKYMFYDVDDFLFYIVTEAEPSRDYVLGYFSKEKVSYDNYNLACIVTFPPFQKRGYGNLLIEFSYEIARRTDPAAPPGTPERPLSDLGLRGYLTYWTGAIVRHLRTLFQSDAFPINQKLTITKTSPKRQSPRRLGQNETISPLSGEKHLTLASIAAAVHLRVDDAAFAMHESGLVSVKGTDGEIVITPELLEHVAKEKKVKIAFLEEEYWLI
ncbi:hypothetical protein E5Q_05149 [Mixia osmundae IAM 14324]|uniref:histone acetyltransferase n=1 Tax=Mixia osmundae (strain CBS 9802 / IAM 14324 / JCM 22182 / KY 12970) TaxID=764103 RepID=G7E6K4_MIXOS|nr:hypothetical protein E5Q_05149 [Mixia osmundae IAM 14324]